MRPAVAITVGLFIAGFTVVSGLRFGVPWPVSAEISRTFALLPLAMMAVANFRARASVPSALAFACGLTMDVLMQGVLGYWAVIYLIAMLLARLASPTVGTFLTGRLAVICGLGLGLFVFQVAVAWGAYLLQPDWRVFAFATMVVTLCAAGLELVLALFGSLALRPGGLGSLARES